MITFLKEKLKQFLPVKEVSFSSFHTFFFKILGLVLSFALLLIITKNYGAQGYGRFSLTLAFGQFLVMILTFGIPLELVKHLGNSKKNGKSILPQVFKIIFISGVIVAISVYFSSGYLSKEVFKDQLYTPYLKYLSVSLVPLMLHEVFIGFAKGKKDFLQHNVFFFLLPPLLFITIFFGLLSYFTEESFSFFTYGLAIALTVVVELLYYKKSIFSGSKSSQTIRSVLKNSMPMMWSLLLLNILTWTDIFMIELLGSSSDVGVYNAAYKIASVGMLVIVSVNVVIGPIIVDLYTKNKHLELHKTIVKTTRLIFMGTLPIILGLAFFSQTLLGYLGDEFISGTPTLYIILIGVAINAFSGNVDMILNMTNYQKTLRSIVVLSFMLNILLDYLLIPFYGIQGAALASLGTQILLNGLSLLFIKKKLGFFTFI